MVELTGTLSFLWDPEDLCRGTLFDCAHFCTADAMINQEKNRLRSVRMHLHRYDYLSRYLLCL